MSWGVGAAELYRYTNDKGVVVLDRQGVPAQFIGKGYEVLNDQGRVVKVVPPAPTPEEMKRILAQRAQAKTDAQLLRLYSTVEDVERAKERKLNELDGVISGARGNLQSLASQQAALQSQAADQERAGRAVPEHLLTQIDNLRSEQAAVKKDVARFQQDRIKAAAGFDADRARIAELVGVRP
ncbi:MAG: DUF4124 domain-containing protein [Pseudomonas sp.]|uniref:DUF4124 domain-containing protein n=1 Tax=Pseudomonas sp. TaxID=306 RepID=UPI00339A2290